MQNFGGVSLVALSQIGTAGNSLIVTVNHAIRFCTMLAPAGSLTRHCMKLFRVTQ